MAETVVSVKQDPEGIAVVSLDRPRARNAMTMESWVALEQALHAVAADPGARVVVLTGAGGYFCAGGDMKTPPSAGFRATAAVARLELAQRVILRLRSYPLPVIAAVEGGAAGLGWSLALACDMVVASSAATFVAPFVERGVVPDGGAAWFLTRRLGRHRAAELLMSGRRVAAEEALAWGLVNHVGLPGEALAEAIALARRFPTAYPHAMELGKRLVDAAENLDLSACLQLEQMTAALCQAGPEAQLARQAFPSRQQRD